MTLDEKLAISRKAFELLDAGDSEGFSRVIRTTPQASVCGKSRQKNNGRRFSNRRRLEFVGSGVWIWLA
jgi:hypothetical protein